MRQGTQTYRGVTGSANVSSHVSVLRGGEAGETADAGGPGLEVTACCPSGGLLSVHFLSSSHRADKTEDGFKPWASRTAVQTPSGLAPHAGPTLGHTCKGGLLPRGVCSLLLLRGRKGR